MSKSLKENYIIRIKSQIEQDGETEQVELMTRGSFALREGSYYITYRETETTGYEGCVTTLKIAADSSRGGPAPLWTPGQPADHRKGPAKPLPLRDRLRLGDPRGDSRRHRVRAEPQGGSARFSYLLDGDVTTLISRNSLEVSVTPYQLSSSVCFDLSKRKES